MKLLRKFLFVLLIITLAFVLPRLIPGSPLFISDSDMHVLNSLMSENNFSIFKEYYAYDKNLLQQFITYLKHISLLDFGYSFYYKLPVIELIKKRLGWTILISGVSIMLSALISIPFALKASLKNKKNRSLFKIMLSIQAVPSFLMAIIFQLLLCYKLNLFPSGDAYTIGFNYSGVHYIIDIIKHAALPIIVLVLSSIPSIFIMTYNLCKKTQQEDFVKMAYFYNISSKDIKYKYILRNCLPEILSKLNIHFLYLISGALFVENVFSYPGMGTLMKTAALNNDYPLIQAMLIIIGLYGLIINIIFEFLIKLTKPRY